MAHSNYLAVPFQLRSELVCTPFKLLVRLLSIFPGGSSCACPFPAVLGTVPSPFPGQIPGSGGRFRGPVRPFRGVIQPPFPGVLRGVRAPLLPVLARSVRVPAGEIEAITVRNTAT